MSTQTISIPWASDTSDSIHLQWDDSGITSGQRVTLPVTVTSDYNYTGEDRETLVTFRTLSSTDNIVKQSHEDWVATKISSRNDNAVLTPESAKEDCLIKVGIGEERFAEKALKIIQTSDNLIIATHTDVYSIYSSNKAGIKQ